MKNLLNIFPLYVYQNNIDELEFNQIVNDTSSFINNSSHKFEVVWKTSPTLTTIDVPKDQNINSKTLENQIKLHVNNYFHSWEFHPNAFGSGSVNMRISDLWVNIAKRDAYQEDHSHGINLFSGVIYINVNKDSGEFQFVNPEHRVNNLIPRNQKYQYTKSIIPYNGLILIFPSWLTHRALPNKSDQDRISIAFNVDTQ